MTKSTFLWYKVFNIIIFLSYQIQNLMRVCSCEIVSSALWFVPEGTQSAWTLQQTHCNLTK